MDNRTSSALILGGALLAGLIATGQEPRDEWQLKRTGMPDRVQFTIDRQRPGNHSINSFDVPFASFRGLKPQTFDRGGHLKFEYFADSGTLLCEGNFSWRHGSGTFTFEPDPKFSAELARLGYDPPTEEQLFTMMLTNVGLEFAHGVSDAGLHASTRQLIDLRTHGVSLDYIRETREAGYRNLSTQDFMDLRVHGVETSFLRDLKTYGYQLYPHDIIQLRIHGVTGQYLGDLKKAGYDLPASQIVDLRIHGVSSNYLQDLRTYGLRPHASDVVQLQTHGVSPDFLKGLKDAGYDRLLVSEITDLRNHGVDTRFIQDAKTLGYNFTPRELIGLRTHGVDGSYLRRLRDSGMRQLSAEQIEKLRIHGVD